MTLFVVLLTLLVADALGLRCRGIKQNNITWPLDECFTLQYHVNVSKTNSYMFRCDLSNNVQQWNWNDKYCIGDPITKNTLNISEHGCDASRNCSYAIISNYPNSPKCANESAPLLNSSLDYNWTTAVVLGNDDGCDIEPGSDARAISLQCYRNSNRMDGEWEYILNWTNYTDGVGICQTLGNNFTLKKQGCFLPTNKWPYFQTVKCVFNDEQDSVTSPRGSCYCIIFLVVLSANVAMFLY